MGKWSAWRKGGRMSKKYDHEKMPKEVMEVYDAFHVMTISARMIYESALQEQFTPAQAMELAKTYIVTQIGYINAKGAKI